MGQDRWNHRELRPATNLFLGVCVLQRRFFMRVDAFNCSNICWTCTRQKVEAIMSFRARIEVEFHPLFRERTRGN